MYAGVSWERSAAERLRAGDAGALAEIYDQFAGYVFALARRVTRDASLAEEVTQDVFCRLWEQPGRFDPDRGSLRTFVGVLTHRRAVDVVRRNESRRRRDAAQAQDGRQDPDLEEQVAAYLTAEELRRAVKRLPERQRRAITLAYFGGHTFREVATVLEVPEGTAKSRIRLGLANLRRTLATARTVS